MGRASHGESRGRSQPPPRGSSRYQDARLSQSVSPARDGGSSRARESRRSSAAARPEREEGDVGSRGGSTRRHGSSSSVARPRETPAARPERGRGGGRRSGRRGRSEKASDDSEWRETVKRLARFMLFLVMTSSPLFFLLALSGVVGALPVHLLGTGLWAALILRVDIAAYPGWFVLVELLGAFVGVLGIGVLAAVGEAGVAALFAVLSLAHLAALDWSRRRLAALLERAPGGGSARVAVVDRV